MNTELKNYLSNEFEKHSKKKLVSEIVFIIFLNQRYNQGNKEQSLVPFKELSRKKLMELLDTKRHPLDLALTYLEGANILYLENHKETTMDFTNTGQQFLKYLKDNKSNVLKQLLNQISDLIIVRHKKYWIKKEVHFLKS